MTLATKGLFIVGAKRTPFCKFGGSLRELPASHAFAAAAKDSLLSAKLDSSFVDATIVGNVNFLSQCDGGKTSRYCGLYSGVPIERPSLAVNKACGSGLQAVINGAIEIITGSANITLTGGTEIMSSLPLIVRNTRFGVNLGSYHQVEEYITKQHFDTYTGFTQQAMAEDLAKKYGIEFEEIDRYTTESRLKWGKAQEDGSFAQELTPLTVTIKKKQILVDKDEIAENFNDTSEIDDDGIERTEFVNFRNVALPADGASAMIVASDDAVSAHHLSPLARIVAWACVGVDPTATGLGAATAVTRLMDVAGVHAGMVDLFEINETFAAQALVSANELRVDGERMNVHGGCLAVGNPAAATGARIITHLVHELRRQNLKTAIAATSCGGGQGVALMIEKV